MSVLGNVVTLTLSSAISEFDHKNLTVTYKWPYIIYDEVAESYTMKDTDGNWAGVISAEVSITRPNSPPEFPSSETGARSVDENTPADTTISTPVAAVDTDNDRLRYSISGTDAAFFDVVASSGQLRTKAALNHESRGSYSFTMSVTDNKDIHGNADTIVDDTISVTVTVSDVDETPEVSGPIAVDFEEGGTGNVAAYTFTDPDQKGIDLVLSGADSEHFTLYSNGDLIFNEPPDFEGKNQYHVTIGAREQGDGTSIGRLNVTIRVTNVNEPGLLETNVEEPRVGQALRLDVEDEDGGESVTEWKWERGEPNSPCGTVNSPTVTTWETITGPRSGSYTPTLADQGHCIRVTAFYDDRAGTGNTEQFLTPNSVKVGPFFSQDPPAFGVRENTAEGATLGQVRASHSNNGETLTYSIAGADAGHFTIDDNAQLKTSATPLDYETQPGKKAVVEITAVDNNGQTATISVTVSVTDDCASSGEAPCAPGRPSVSSLSTSSLKVTWSTPATPSSTSITGYELEYRESDGGGWIPELLTGTDRSHTIENLTEGTDYEVRVRARNDSSGYGEWSMSETGSPGAATRVILPPNIGVGGGGFGGGGGWRTTEHRSRDHRARRTPVSGAQHRTGVRIYGRRP